MSEEEEDWVGGGGEACTGIQSEERGGLEEELCV